MKKTVLYSTLLMVVLVLGACTRNHGDIGMWFGTWHIESITMGGRIYQYLVPITAEGDLEGDYFFQFQSHAFRVSLVGDREQLVESFGTWDESEDGRLTVTFPDASVYYIQMPGLEADNNFTVNAESKGQIVLSKAMADGTPVVYSLKKQP